MVHEKASKMDLKFSRMRNGSGFALEFPGPYSRNVRAVQHPGVSSTFRRFKSDVFSDSHVVKSQCFFHVSVYLKEGEKLSIWNLRNRAF